MPLSRPSDPFRSLPPEILFEILKHLGREDRLHLCLASGWVRKAIGDGQNLAPLTESYRLYARNCLAAALTTMNVNASFHFPSEVFQSAVQFILQGRRNFFFTPQQTVIVLAPNDRAAVAFAAFLKRQDISWIDVFLSGGFVDRATRSELRRKSEPGVVTVVVTHRADGKLPSAGHVLALSPSSAQSLHDLLYFSPTTVHILWPFHEVIADKYTSVKRWLWNYDRTNVPNELFKLKPIIQTVPSDWDMTETDKREAYHYVTRPQRFY